METGATTLDLDPDGLEPEFRLAGAVILLAVRDLGSGNAELRFEAGRFLLSHDFTAWATWAGVAEPTILRERILRKHGRQKS